MATAAARPTASTMPPGSSARSWRAGLRQRPIAAKSAARSAAANSPPISRPLVSPLVIPLALPPHPVMTKTLRRRRVGGIPQNYGIRQGGIRRAGRATGPPGRAAGPPGCALACPDGAPVISLSLLNLSSPVTYLIAVLLPALDALLPVVPSETAIVALGVATAGSTDPRIAL